MHEDDLAAVVSAYDDAVAKACPDGPAGRNCTWIFGDRHLAGIEALLDDARAEGTTVRPVGREDPGAPPRAMRPTVVPGVTNDMAIAHEEISGPVVPVFAYRSLDGAIAFVEALVHGGGLVASAEQHGYSGQMPFKHNAARRCRIPKRRHRVTNWPAHEAGLRRRGDLTFWLDKAAPAGWQAPRRSTPGGQPRYSDLAIELVSPPTF